MFSDRFWIIKVAAAAGLFSFLCHRAARELAPLFPEPEQVMVNASPIQGRAIHFWAKRVIAETPTGFDINTKVGPLHVVADAPRPRVGEVVTFKGTVLGTRQVEAKAIQVNEGYTIKRGLTYGISVLVVAAFLWSCRRRFRLSLRDGVFRSRY